MPLFAPSLHQVRVGETFTTVSGTADSIVYYDDTLKRGVRSRAAQHAQEETWIFALMGLLTDSTQSLTNFATGTTLASPRFDFTWPYDFTCYGLRFGVSARASTGTAAGIQVLRAESSVFSNAAIAADPVTGAFCTVAVGSPVVASGTALISSEVAPHASHVSWSAGDRIRCWITQGTAGAGATARFHGPKLYVRGARR